jgi:hypothetical protein
MVTAHHDAESPGGCLIALEDPEDFLVGAEQERGVASSEDGAPARRILEHAVSRCRSRWAGRLPQRGMSALVVSVG